jgi:hypothetical protein
MFVHDMYYCVVHWNEGRQVGIRARHARVFVFGMLTCTYSVVGGIAYHELHTCATLSSQRSTYSLGAAARDEGTQRALAESIAANPDIALIDLQGVDLSPYVDVLGVPDKLQGNRAILAHVQAQRIAQQRVKSAKGGTR